MTTATTHRDLCEQAEELVTRINPWDGQPYTQDECEKLVRHHRLGYSNSGQRLVTFLDELKEWIANACLPVFEIVPEAFTESEHAWLTALPGAPGPWQRGTLASLAKTTGRERLDAIFPGRLDQLHIPDYGGTTVIHSPGDGSWLEVFLGTDDVRDVLTRAINDMASFHQHHHPDDVTDTLEAIAAVHACCDPLGMPDLDDGRRVWAIDADAMWRLVEGPDQGGDESALRTRGVLLREMPELADRGRRDRDLDDQRAIDSIAAQLGGTPVRERDS